MTFDSGQIGITGNRFTFLPETTKIIETTVLKTLYLKQ